jgi:hypothetical protein
MLRNTLGTWMLCWKLIENLMGISWEHVENNKNPTPPPTPKETKTWASWVHATSPHCLQEFFLSTCIWVLRHFWPRLMTRPWTMGVHSTLEYVESEIFLTPVFFLKTQIIRLVSLHSYATMLFETTRIWSNPITCTNYFVNESVIKKQITKIFQLIINYFKFTKWNQQFFCVG